MTQVFKIGKASLVVAVALSATIASAKSLDFKPSHLSVEASCPQPTKHLSTNTWGGEDVPDLDVDFKCKIKVIKDLGPDKEISNKEDYVTLFSVSQTFAPGRKALNERQIEVASIKQYLDIVLSSAIDQGRYVKLDPTIFGIDDGEKLLALSHRISDKQLVGDVVLSGSVLNQAPQEASAAAASSAIQNKIIIKTDGGTSIAQSDRTSAVAASSASVPQ